MANFPEPEPPAPPEFVYNEIVKTLQKREAGSAFDRRALSEDRFQRLTLKNTYQVEIEANNKHSIKQILVHHGICVVLFNTGKVKVSSLADMSVSRVLNPQGDSFIHRIHYNRYQESLITEAITAVGYTCSSIRFSLLLLEHENVNRLFADSGPLSGIIIDHINAKIIIQSRVDGKMTVYNMEDYNMFYFIDETKTKKGLKVEFRVSIGMFMLLSYTDNPPSEKMKIEIRSIENGILLNSFSYRPVRRTARFSFILFHRDKILIKQEKQQLQIVDVHTSVAIDVPKKILCDNSFCRELSGLPLFLKCSGGRTTTREQVEVEGDVSILDLDGNQVTLLEDHRLLQATSIGESFRKTAITHDMKFIISCCTDRTFRNGCIRVNDLRTGKSVSQISPPHADIITALQLIEDREEIYSGTDKGEINVYSY